MAKRRASFTEKTIKKMIKEGRGKGEGAEYKPWITIRDLPSKGRCTETVGWKTGRMHHLLSKLETKYFFQLEWADNVIDIREQFPLLDSFDTYEETKEIAAQIGIEYPIVPKTRTPNVMTTDFLITVDVNGELVTRARTVKYANDLSDQRTIEKLEIERIFWERRDIDWKIITEKQINNNLVFNVEYVHKCKSLNGFDYVKPRLINQVQDLLIGRNDSNIPLAEITMAVDNELGLKNGTTLFIVKHLIANKVFKIDISRKIETAKPLIFETGTILRKEAVV